MESSYNSKEDEFKPIVKNNEKISLGINIGSLNTVYSIFSKDDGRFKTNVLLSDVSKGLFLLKFVIQILIDYMVILRLL